VAGVRAIGIDDRAGDRIILRALVTGEPSHELDARLAEVRQRVRAAFPAIWPEPAVEFEQVHAGADLAAIFRAPAVLTGDLAWFEPGADAAHAGVILALAARFDARTPLGAAPSEEWLRTFRRAMGLRMGGPGFEPREIREGVITLRTGWYGWVSSYEQGWRVTDVFSAPLAALPAAPEDAARFILEVEALVAGEATTAVPTAPPSAEHQCAYCRKTFAPLEFDSRLGACHTCAVTHGGAVY
jgi:hypothetical protein